MFAGTLLTFIPAAGDYINAELLGNVNTGMIGSQIEKLFIAESNYPAAAALSFIFMAIITAGVLLYATRARHGRAPSMNVPPKAAPSGRRAGSEDV